MNKVSLLILIILTTTNINAQLMNYLFGTGWSKSDRLEYLLECREGDIKRNIIETCDCNLAYMEKNYASLGWYRRNLYELSKDFVDSYDNPDRRKKIKQEEERERQKRRAWVNNCLRDNY